MKIIGHIDLDAFFASVEEREKPWLKGLPIVVGADPLGGQGRGVVSTANYAARKYGIRSALPISQAWRFSEAARAKGLPGASFITPRFKKYEKASREVFSILRRYARKVEVTSVDEAHFDMSPCRSFAKAEAMARWIKRDIKKKTKLTASIGIGPNKMIAKIAAGIRKPDGLLVVDEEGVADFLAPLSIKELPGIGPKTATMLSRRGIETVKDLRNFSWQELEAKFGKWGFDLFERAHGIGSATFSGREAPKSIGQHETFDRDTRDFKLVFKTIEDMAEKIIRRMKRGGFTGFRTVVATIRFDDFETKTRSVTGRAPLSSAKELHAKGMKLVLPFFEKKENPRKKAIRLVGLRIEQLSQGDV